jgi:hypothetical protein
MTIRADREDTGRFASYKEQIGAVEHFLELNGLSALNFKLTKNLFEKHMKSPDKLIPICLRDYGKSSTTVFIKNFVYDPCTETLTVEAKELLKYLQ